MSRIGQWRLELQSLPEYRQGWDAHEAGKPCHPGDLHGDAREAWCIGWGDARQDHEADPS